MRQPYISGISILGGEPLEPENIDKVCDIVSICKRHFPNKTVWVYTGNKFEDYLNNACLMRNTDVIVDGRFEIDKRDITLKFRGSSNQRLIDVQESIKQGKTILYEE